MKYLILALTLAACGGGEGDPHLDGDCDTTWRSNGYDACEQGCEDFLRAYAAEGPACPALTIGNANVQCSMTFEYGGQRGCCTTTKPEVHFADCK